MRVQIDPIADPNREIIEKIRSRMIILLHTLRDRSRRGQRRDLQYGAPNVPTFGMSRDRRYYYGDVSDGSYDSERPKTPNRK